MGAASTVLLGLVAAKFFRSLPHAVLTVFVFLSSPIVFRQLWSGGAWPLELAVSLAWLLATMAALDHSQRWAAAVPGVIAGAGLYIHGAAMVRMPLMAALAAIVIWYSATRAARQRAAIVVAAFVALAAPMVIHYTRHPELFNQLVTAHGLYDASRFNLLQGAREIVSWVGLVARSEAYHDYFDPSVWFLSGTLLWPLAFLIPIGLYRLLSAFAPPAQLILGMMLIAPVPTALIVSRPASAHLLFAVPVMMVSAMLGAQYLLTRLSALGGRYRSQGIPQRPRSSQP